MHFPQAFTVWWAFIKDGWQWITHQYWILLAKMSVPITLAYAAFTVLLYLKVKFVPSEIIYVISSYVLIILIAPACAMLVYLLICSLTSKGRRIFNDFRCLQSTELEKFKREAEDKFTSLNKKLDNIDDTLKKMAGNTSHAETPSKATRKTKKEGKKKSGKT